MFFFGVWECGRMERLIIGEKVGVDRIHGYSIRLLTHLTL